MEYEIEIKGRKLLFGNAANNDYVQDATGEDFIQWYSDKIGSFSKREDGLWAYKGLRDVLEAALYSGINNYARVSKDKTLRVTFDEAKEFSYELEYDERNKIVESFLTGVSDALKMMTGEKKAQEPAVN